MTLTATDLGKKLANLRRKTGQVAGNSGEPFMGHDILELRKISG